MPRAEIEPTDVERRLGRDDIIVSKTDLAGRIRYANQVFLDIADYDESEVLGKPHNLIRHPDMPRTIFKLFWDRLAQGAEIFAYVKNLCKHGEYYWVFAHATPSFGEDGQIVGYHSTRRAPDRAALDDVAALYDELRAIEESRGNRKDGLAAGIAALDAKLAERNLDYDRFCFSHLEQGRAA